MDGLYYGPPPLRHLFSRAADDCTWFRPGYGRINSTRRKYFTRFKHICVDYLKHIRDNHFIPKRRALAGLRLEKMMSKNDTSSAFPCNTSNEDKPGACYPDPGMTLRDYFAAKAMQAMLASEFEMYAVEHKHPGGMGVGERWAQQAYQMADLMLAERAK